MQTVLIVVHLMIVLALVGVVLIQRSEGGGLGIGGGSGFMSARGAANALTRTTAILATAFFLTSLALGILARYDERPSDILDRIPTETQGTGEGILNQLGGEQTPPADAPSTTAPADESSGVPTGAPTETAPAASDAATEAPAAETPAAEPAPAAPADGSGVPTGQ